MRIRHWITVVALLALVVATIVGVFLTDGGPALLPKRAARNNLRSTTQLVDQKPLQTA